MQNSLCYKCEYFKRKYQKKEYFKIIIKGRISKKKIFQEIRILKEIKLITMYPPCFYPP